MPSMTRNGFLLVIFIAFGCKSDAASPARQDDGLGLDRPVDDGGLSVEDIPDSGPGEPDGVRSEEGFPITDRDSSDDGETSEAPDLGDVELVHEWTPILQRCREGFVGCEAPGWYLPSTAFLHLDAQGDIEGGNCTAVIFADGEGMARCYALPCNVRIALGENRPRVTIEVSVRCWGEEKRVVKDFSVLHIHSDQYAPCVKWGDFEKTIFMFPDDVLFYGAPRVYRDIEGLAHLAFARCGTSLPRTERLVHLFQVGEEEWRVEYPPDAFITAYAPMGMTMTPDRALHLLSVEELDPAVDTVAPWLIHRVKRGGTWTLRKPVMPTSVYPDSMCTLTTDEDGRLDGLMFILRTGGGACLLPEWAWLCDLFDDHDATVLLRAKEMNDGSWEIARVDSPENHVGLWMYVSETHFMYHENLVGIGSAAFLANRVYIGFLTLEPSGVTETKVCDYFESSGKECSYWATAAPSPRRDSLVAIVAWPNGHSVVGELEELRFTPGLPVARNFVPWSAEVAGYGFDWPLFVHGMSTSAGYQQMVIDSLGRKHLVLSFYERDWKGGVSLYIREYPDGEGHEWQIERIEGPGVAFLTMDSQASVQIFMFNNDGHDGPEGIRLLTRRCEEYLDVGR